MRYHVFEPEVRRVSDRLRALVEQAGSVNAACIGLNAALGFSSGYKRIYPNRLHGLLSKDMRKAINEDTLKLVSAALDKLDGIVRQPIDNNDDINEWL